MKTRPKKTQALWVNMKGGDQQVKRARQIKVVSDSRAKQMREYLTLRRKWLQGRPCWTTGIGTAQGLICHAERHPAQDVHHSVGRANKLLNDQRYWIGLCRKSHIWVDAHRAEAKALGLILAGWNSGPKD